MIEYKVIRAPEDPGRSILGRSKSSYAEALGLVLNEQGIDDWEFVRSEPGPDRHPVLVFRRTVKKLEDDLPGITLLDHKPPKERAEVRPRRARELMDEDRETLDRLKAGRRRIVVEKPGETQETLVELSEQTAPKKKNNVADILEAKIAKAHAQSPQSPEQH